MTQTLKGWNPEQAGKDAAASDKAGTTGDGKPITAHRPRWWKPGMPIGGYDRLARARSNSRSGKLLDKRLDAALEGVGLPDPDNLVGERFGLVTVIRKLPSIRTGSRWLVRCECGHERGIRYTDLCRGPKTHRSCKPAGQEE